METLNTLDSTKEILNDLTNETKELKEELVGKPWEVTYLHESQDGKYKIYSYTVKTWGNLWWIKNQYEKQIWPWVEWTHFTDAKWRPESQIKYNAWDIVFIKVPKTPILDITKDEILKIPDNDIKRMYQEDYNSMRNPKARPNKEYADAKWHFIKYHNKKIYSDSYNWMIDSHTKSPIILYDYREENGYLFTDSVSISKKVWNKYYWIYYEHGKKVYRWELEREFWFTQYIPKPKNYEKRQKDPKTDEDPKIKKQE